MFFFQAEDGIRDTSVTGVQTCALLLAGRREALDPRREGVTSGRFERNDGNRREMNGIARRGSAGGVVQRLEEDLRAGIRHPEVRLVAASDLARVRDVERHPEVVGVLQ